MDGIERALLCMVVCSMLMGAMVGVYSCTTNETNKRCFERTQKTECLK